MITPTCIGPGFRLFCQDVFEWLQWAPDDHYDLILTDPPYESMEKHRAKGTTTRLKNGEWFDVISNEQLAEVILHLYRILKRDRHCYVFCDWETGWRCVATAAEAAGFTVWTPIIWDKMVMGMGYHYRSRYEMVMFLEKGKRRIADLGEPNVQAWKRVRGGYPTEKPVGFGELLVRQSTQEGELVLDPFMGSGAFGEAVVRQGRRFHGVDAKEGAVQMAEGRLREVCAP